MVALFLAGASFLLAGVANERADNQDSREERISDSVNAIGINLSAATGDYRGLTMKEPKKSSRSMVYVGVVSGVVFTATGLICLVLPSGPGVVVAPTSPANKESLSRSQVIVLVLLSVVVLGALLVTAALRQ